MLGVIILLYPSCNSLDVDRPNIIWLTTEDNSSHHMRLYNENGVIMPLPYWILIEILGISTSMEANCYCFDFDQIVHAKSVPMNMGCQTQWAKKS